MVHYNQKPLRKEYTQHYNIYYEKSVKTTTYSSFTNWLIRPFKHLKSYIITTQKTRFAETLLDCFSISLVFVLFYFLSIFLCAIDDQCSALYMGGV